ncbi:dihydromonapterin reductase [Psychrobium sp. 1_MG-2023]|uniref:dihydromonapterin reductase n=1 Tax=Psychrobium sp. 1_MG-2023 TaxID=3062624 RepID=UPI000C33F353|nr:dihydromonapterin reductase [Psychrobium sp. 1_MG-2023]MDP2561365.1 dihydromonapterin reductase [Psychrobium sp. 1_MG-2023]PKF54846.1 dihydromonapterin reductase [Alteromonadales bacterium alter-6D02]
MSQTILITGIGKRLGLALATHFLAQGYHVVGTYRTTYPALDGLKSQAADLYQVDFYQQAQVDEFVALIKHQYSSLRAIIHNASDWLPDNSHDSSSEYSSAQVMLKMMTIHASIPYQINLACQGLLKNTHNEAGNFADIIHLSDYVAEKGSKKHIAYAASKTAMNSLTLSFSALLAPEVKVNSISPALIKFNEHDDNAYKAKAINKALLAKEAGYEEIIRAIEFILSSEYMTGRNMQLDGGRHLK